VQQVQRDIVLYMSFKNNRDSHIKNSALSISALISRLPLSQQMNESQASIVKLTPAWLAWAEKNLSPSYTNSVQLISVRNSNKGQNSELCIASENANCATQIKHQQNSLLTALHAEGFKNIQKLCIRLAMPTEPVESCIKQDSTASSHSANNADFITQKYAPSKDSITLIESCQKRVTNEHLSTSLARLSETLKKTLSD